MWIKLLKSILIIVSVVIIIAGGGCNSTAGTLIIDLPPENNAIGS
jgi:hypothetical protein